MGNILKSLSWDPATATAATGSDLDRVGKSTRFVKNDNLCMKAAKIRLLEDFALPVCGLTLEDVHQLKDKVYVHPQCSGAIREAIEASETPSDDAEEVIRDLTVEDYHSPRSAEKIARWLDENKSGDPKLDRIFAVDGSGGSSYADYLFNLKYPLDDEPTRRSSFDPARLHAKAVRSMYEAEPNAARSEIRESICRVLLDERDLRGFGELYLRNFKDSEESKRKVFDWALENRFALDVVG